MFSKKYGGKKAFLAYTYHRLLYSLGVYRKYSDLDWDRVGRLVFICTGNINRSVYAEFSARNLGLDSISYGIDADKHKGASNQAVRNAGCRQLDLRPHKCRPLNSITLNENDLLLAMEPMQAKAINGTIELNKAQISLLGLWSDQPTPYIQDPILRSDGYYQNCFEVIDRSIANINDCMKRPGENTGTDAPMY